MTEIKDTRAELERELGRLVYQKSKLELELQQKNVAIQKVGAALEALDGK